MAMKTKGVQENLVKTMKSWQGVEDEKKHANLLTSLATIKSGLYKVS